MNIDLGTGKIKVTYKGSEIVIKEPTLADVKSFEKDEDKENAMFNFMKRLGMSDATVEEMGIYALKRFTDQLLEPLAKKK